MKSNKLRSDAIISFSFKGLSALFSLIFGYILNDRLGSEYAGYIFWSISIITMLSPVGCFGLKNVVLRLIAKGERYSSYTHLGVIVKSILIVSFSSVLVIAIFYLANGVLIENEEKVSIASIFIISFLFVNLISILESAYQGKNNIVISSILSGILLNSILICALFFEGIDHILFSYVFLISNIAIFVLSLTYWISSDRYRELKFPTNDEMNKVAITMLLIQLASQLNAQFPGVFLGTIANGEIIAVYAICLKLSTSTSFILFAVNKVVSQRFAKLYYKGELEELRKVVQWSTRVMLSISIPILLIIVIFSDEILGFYGGEFLEYKNILYILLAGQFINVATGSVGFLLQMTGNEKHHRFNVMVSAMLSVSLCMVLTPMFGIYGAAFSTFVGLASTNLLSCIKVNKLLSINTLKFW